PTERAIEWFDFDGLGRSPARFDMKKLDSLNAHYMREMSDGALADEALAFAARMKPDLARDTQTRARLTAAMPFLKPRAKTLVELLEKADFLFTSGAPAADKAAAQALSSEARAMLARLAQELEAETWEAPALEARARAFADREGLKLGDLAQPLRA